MLLLTAILTASRGAATKNPVTLLEGLLLEAEEENVRISGYDMKIGIVTTIPAEVEKDGGIVLNARLLGEIVRKMPGQYITISVGSGYVAEIRSEMSEFEILGSPTSDYPILPTIDGQDSIEINEGVLKKMIAQTNFAVGDDESRPIHTGAQFETSEGELTIVAVDGYRLALRREPLKNVDVADLSFVVPGTALGEVERITSDNDDTVTITLGSKHILFSIGDTILISRRLEGEFLNYKNTIPQSAKYQLTVEKIDFIAAVERVSLIISDKMKSPVKCVFGDGVVNLYAASALGKASDECGMDGNGDNLEMGFNNRFLLEVLKAAPVEQVNLELNTGITPCILSPADDKSNFLYMILPVRLKAYES